MKPSITSETKYLYGSFTNMNISSYLFNKFTENVLIILKDETEDININGKSMHCISSGFRRKLKKKSLTNVIQKFKLKIKSKEKHDIYGRK